MPKVDLPKKDEIVDVYNPTSKEREVLDFVSKRVQELKDYRQEKLPNNNKSIETIWKEADREYQPHELSLGRSSTMLESTAEGARVVKLGAGSGWQSKQSSPDLYVKINTALSILVDQNPEAVFIPTSKKYEANTQLAYGNWKNSWEVSGAKQQVKNMIFNMCKYGTGIMRTYPKMVDVVKKIRTEYYPDQPEKDKYNEKKIIKFNDLCRESLNPNRVWISEAARPGDYSTIDDWYFEKEYSYDKLKQEFKDYSNLSYVPRNAHEVNENIEEAGQEISKKITVGFYENQILDIYAIYIPSVKVLLYYSPLPNDDGMLSLSVGQWSLRHDELIYGIGLYEIIKQDCVLYDRLLNMTIDQLTMAIYKMFFYKGTDIFGQNGQIVIEPGKGTQVMDPANVKFLEVPGPGQEAWKGLQFLQDRKDQLSGVTPQLTAQYAGKTLGQDLQAKEAALERMKTPLDYILDCLQQEAYITLSWQKQILSTPEVLEYTSPELLQLSLKEIGLGDQEIEAYMQEMANPSEQSELLFSGEPNVETGEQRQFANVYKEKSYSLEQDDKGELIESDDMRFYRFGVDLPIGRLDWKGIIRIKPQSVLAPSKELTKRMKLDMFNLLYPAINGMLAQPQFIPVLLPPLKQIVKVYEEEAKDWFDEQFLMQLNQEAMQPKGEPAPEQPRINFSVQFEMLVPDIQKQILEKYVGLKIEEPLFIDKNTGQGMPSGAPQSPVMNAMPQGEVEQQPDMSQTMDMVQGGEMGIKPIAGLNNGGQSSNEDLIANMPMQ